jgi:hypothetical protein
VKALQLRSRIKRAPLRTAAAAIRNAISALHLAQFAVAVAEKEQHTFAKVAEARARGATWPECAALFGLPKTRRGGEAARHRFLRSESE